MICNEIFNSCSGNIVGKQLMLYCSVVCVRLAPRYQCAFVSVHPLAARAFKQRADKGTVPRAMWHEHNRQQLKTFGLFIIGVLRVNRGAMGEHRGDEYRAVFED